MENTKQGRERKENSTEHTRRTRGAYVHHIEDGRQRSLDRCCQTPPWISLRSSGNCDQRPLPGRSPTSHRHCTDICAVNGACIFLTQPTQHKTSAVTTLFHCHTKKNGERGEANVGLRSALGAGENQIRRMWTPMF